MRVKHQRAQRLIVVDAMMLTVWSGTAIAFSYRRLLFTICHDDPIEHRASLCNRWWWFWRLVGNARAGIVKRANYAH
jgi:hypothetical protein